MNGTKPMINVISTNEACKILREHGMSISPAHLRAGIECGAYPFGVAVRMEKQCAYEIYVPLLRKWIEERSE
ncbi:MAG: hypothetical protein IKN66_00070 [Ruminococcus sp.]|nr:hypothetical protein [Ruminococcus sp.]